jgi:hypothetical protein
MTNELKTPIEIYGNNGDQRRYTCASNTAIVQGTVLKLTSPKTASASDGVGQPFAGIASMDKSGSDNSTGVSAWENGLFDAVASMGITVGCEVITSGDGNKLAAASSVIKAAGTTFAYVVGIAQESAVDGGNFAVRILN